MIKMELNARKAKILFAVINEYILTAEPISSKTIAEKYQLMVSSATIRTELAALEMMGYLKQPHTSAGRVPTDCGYRFYVDNLGSEKPAPDEENSINNLFSTLDEEIEELMRQTSLLLSRLTKYTAMVFTSVLSKSRFKHLDLIYLNFKTVLMVLVTDRGYVTKRVLKFKDEIDENNIVEVEEVLNKIFYNFDLKKIKVKKKELMNYPVGARKLLKEITIQIIECLAEEEKEKVYLNGTTNILYQPEFESIEKIQSLLETLEHRYVLVQFLKDAVDSKQVIIRIGSENKQQEMKDCSFVGSTYNLGGYTTGTLGVIGPTRMDYAKIISTVNCIARNLSKTLESLHS